MNSSTFPRVRKFSRVKNVLIGKFYSVIYSKILLAFFFFSFQNSMIATSSVLPKSWNDFRRVSINSTSLVRPHLVILVVVFESIYRRNAVYPCPHFHFCVENILKQGIFFCCSLPPTPSIGKRGRNSETSVFLQITANFHVCYYY